MPKDGRTRVTEKISRRLRENLSLRKEARQIGIMQDFLVEI